MLKFFRNPVVLALIVGAALLAAAPPADAAFKVKIETSSGTTVDLEDGVGTDVLDGILTFNGSVGAFQVVFSFTASKPNAPNGTHVANIHQTVTIQKNSSANDNIRVTATDTDFSLGSFAGAAAVMTSTAGGGGSLLGTASFQSWYSASNGEFSMTVPPDITSGAHPANQVPVLANIPSGTNPFSLTNRVTFLTGTATGVASVDADTNITTPEPGTIVLLCTAVPGFVFAGYRRYRRKAV